MDIDEFLRTEPESDRAAISALWWQAKGDWDKAHKLVQAEAIEANNWVHAYLHRVEGDTSNAAYWYQRANKPVCEGDQNAEWLAILTALSA